MTLPEQLPDTIGAPALYEALAAAPRDTLAVVCVSHRLAQHLLDGHARVCLAAGRQAWETPAVLGFEAFLEQLGEALRLDRPAQAPLLPAPLAAQEERLLWRLAVAQTRSALPLLREGEAAALAAEAWNLVHEHGLPLPLIEGTPDVERFNLWAADFRQRCAALGRSDAARRRVELVEAIAVGRVPVPARIVLAGFHDLTPLLQRSVDALRAAGAQLLRLLPVEYPATVRTLQLTDGEQELRAAAAWARHCAEADPQARIAVVVPDLGARRAQVQRLFDEQLCPAVEAPESHSPARPYNLTLGETLAATGLVQTALRLLRLVQEPLPAAEAGALLCSGSWGAGEDERLERAALDALLRREGHLQVGLDVLAALARSDGLRARFAALAALRQPQRRHSAGEWIEPLSAVLAAAGWPGTRALDSEEFQACQAWRECLVELVRLEAVLGRVPYSAVLTQLREIAEQTVFQPQSLAGGIQVMGALEAEGLDFDRLWVAGLDDERWPPPGRPHPFLPYALQRRRALPHASAAQELARAQRMTARWAVAAPEVVLSWPAQEQDRPLSPSPLLAPWRAATAPLSTSTLPPAWQAQQGAAIETVLDAQAPPLAPGESPTGGARLLGDQALCPFRGFATHRLGARALEVPAPGLSAADRGNLVHAVLEDLWHQLRDQQGLLALDEAPLAEKIGTAVDAALRGRARAAPERLRPGLRSLEERRLAALIRAWLEQEKLRLPFRVIELEGVAPGQPRAADHHVAFEGLTLRLRPDRIDELDGGGRLVIDYKTGARRKLPWADGRPEEPQLLIYALSGGGPVVALAYGRVLAGDTAFEGIAREADLAPGIKAWDSVDKVRDASSWDALFGRWRAELATVAGEVREGWAAVSPKHPRQTCRDCDLHALCRIRESVAEVADEEGEA